MHPGVLQHRRTKILEIACFVPPNGTPDVFRKVTTNLFIYIKYIEYFSQVSQGDILGFADDFVLPIKRWFV
jgi:hypothetical protein